MQHKHRCENDLDIPYLQTKSLPTSMEEEKLDTQYQRVQYGDNNVSDTKTVEIGPCCAIEYSWAQQRRHGDHAVWGPSGSDSFD